METSYACGEQFFKLVVRVLCDDRLPQRREASDTLVAYVYGNTADNQSSCLEKAILLHEAGVVSHICICDGETGHGYPGFLAWREYLVARGIPCDHILPVSGPETRDSVNTLSEAQVLVRTAREVGWKELVLVAAPFHQVRGFITVVSLLLREYPALKVYSEVGTPLRWDELALHSQGTLRDTRSNLVGEELTRMQRFHAQGDLVSAEAVLSYLEKRDA